MRLFRLALALMQHAIADKAVADADQRADLADFPGKLHRGGDHRLGRLVVHTNSLKNLHRDRCGPCGRKFLGHVCLSAADSGPLLE